MEKHLYNEVAKMQYTKKKKEWFVMNLTITGKELKATEAKEIDELVSFTYNNWW